MPSSRGTKFTLSCDYHTKVPNGAPCAFSNQHQNHQHGKHIINIAHFQRRENDSFFKVKSRHRTLLEASFCGRRQTNAPRDLANACDMQQSKGGGAMFCMSGFKNVVVLMVYETQTSIILYVMCKAQPPGVHQAAHDGPDGGWQGASTCTLDYRNLQKPSTLKGFLNMQT